MLHTDNLISVPYFNEVYITKNRFSDDMKHIYLF